MSRAGGQDTEARAEVQSRRAPARPHRRVGNVSPGAVSGRSADLDGRRFRERSEDRVRWDPVDEVHYVSSTRFSGTTQPQREAHVPRSAAEEDLGFGVEADSETDAGDEPPAEPTRRGTHRQAAMRPSARDRAVATLAALRALPGRVVSWVGSHRRLSIAILCLAIVLFGVYGPIQRYYVAWRAAGDLQAEYEAVSSDNEALRDDLSRLQSEEGIQDEARRRGYTYPDEESTTAEGISDDANEGSSATDSDFSAADIQQPWYIHVLDFIFVYQGVD